MGKRRRSGRKSSGGGDADAEGGLDQEAVNESLRAMMVLEVDDEDELEDELDAWEGRGGEDDDSDDDAGSEGGDVDSAGEDGGFDDEDGEDFDDEDEDGDEGSDEDAGSEGNGEGAPPTAQPRGSFKVAKPPKPSKFDVPTVRNYSNLAFCSNASICYFSKRHAP